MNTWPLIQCFVWTQAAAERRGHKGLGFADLQILAALEF